MVCSHLRRVWSQWLVMTVRPLKAQWLHLETAGGLQWMPAPTWSPLPSRGKSSVLLNASWPCATAFPTRAGWPFPPHLTVASISLSAGPCSITSGPTEQPMHFVMESCCLLLSTTHLENNNNIQKTKKRRFVLYITVFSVYIFFKCKFLAITIPCLFFVSRHNLLLNLMRYSDVISLRGKAPTAIMSFSGDSSC